MSNKAAGVFKKTFMGGFNKADVLEYLDKVTYQYEQDKKELNERITALEEEGRKAEANSQELTGKLEEEKKRAELATSYANGLRDELTRQQSLNEEKSGELELQKSLSGQLQSKLEQ